MTATPKSGAVIYAKNLSQLSEFYAAVLGFEVSRSEPDHVVLESPTLRLVILAIPSAIASTIEIASPPKRRTETPIKLYFFCAEHRRIARDRGETRRRAESSRAGMGV